MSDQFKAPNSETRAESNFLQKGFTNANLRAVGKLLGFLVNSLSCWGNKDLNNMNQGHWIRKAKNNLNVIFIHGINSSEECWKHKDGSYWPDLLKDEDELADAGIYVFSYRTGLNTGSYSLDDVVDSLKEHFI